MTVAEKIESIIKTLESQGHKGIQMKNPKVAEVNKNSFMVELFSPKIVEGSSIIDEAPVYEDDWKKKSGVLIEWYSIPKGKRKPVLGYKSFPLKG